VPIASNLQWVDLQRVLTVADGIPEGFRGAPSGRVTPRGAELQGLTSAMKTVAKSARRGL